MNTFNKWIRFTQPFYFLLVCLCLYNPTQQGPTYFENALIRAHYITLVPNTLILFYLFNLVGRFKVLETMLTTRLNHLSFEHSKKRIILGYILIYLFINYGYHAFFFKSDHTLTSFTLFILLATNALLLTLSAWLLIAVRNRKMALILSFCINFGFHYLIIVPFFT